MTRRVQLFHRQGIFLIFDIKMMGNYVGEA